MLHLVIWEQEDGNRFWDISDDESVLADTITNLVEFGIRKKDMFVFNIDGIKPVPLKTVLSWKEGGVT